jgi:fused signal recognition particle receptor
MFKFLKKKLKIFEDELEAELKKDIEKDEKKAERLDAQEKPIKEIKPIEKTYDSSSEKELEFEKLKDNIIPKDEQQKSIRSKPEINIDEKKEILIKKDEKLIDKERKEKFALEKKIREEEIDQQIKKTIETELEHTLKTKRSIEEVVKSEKKISYGVNEDKLDDLLWDLEVGLLESDVAYNVIESIKRDIKEELKHISIERGKVSEVVENVLKNAITHVLKSNEIDFIEYVKKKPKPIVIMFVGVNGSGKTLSIAKIATLLKKHGLSSVMAAGDTFRAGAIEQLSIHAEKVGVKIIKHGSGADPAAVAFDAIDHARAKHKDVVLLDTAGRVQTNINLMDEMAKIKRVAKPSLIIFVGDALSGNDAVEQAKRFNEVVGIDGVILTKVDTDAKGGSALSVAYTIGKPLLFIGTGQGYEDQIPFDPQWMISNIFAS